MSARSKVAERRRFTRSPLDSWLADLTARVRPGLPVNIREVSSGGCVIDTNRSLLPGARAEIAVASSVGSCLLRARVMRCHVRRISATAVTFAAALEFDELVDWHRLIPALSWLESAAEVTDSIGQSLP